MNTMTITPEMIRRFPFAVRPDRIEQADEAWIAAEMARRVRAEQINRGFRPGALPMSSNNATVVAIEKQTLLQNRIVMLMRDNEPRTVTQLAIVFAAKAHDVRVACTALVAAGALSQVSGKKNANVYQHATAARRTGGVKKLTRIEACGGTGVKGLST